MIHPSVMGVINASPNSFYNPVHSVESAMREADAMVVAGAAMIDVGGAASNPDVVIKSDAPSVQEELDRVIPIIEALHERFDVLLSVDTSQAMVMSAAVTAGARMINDQRALSQDHALETAARLQVPICLMHFFSEPRAPGSMSLDALLLQIKSDLSAAVQRCEDAGISRNHLFIDPGFGRGNFYKNTTENYYLLAQLSRFKELGLPILVAWSRKSMIGDVLGVPVEDRLQGSIAAAVIAAMQGADVIRVHDVKATVDAMKIFQAMAQHL